MRRLAIYWTALDTDWINFSKALLISGWNITMSAKTPHWITISNNLDVAVKLRILLICWPITMTTIPFNNWIALVPLKTVMRRYNTYQTISKSSRLVIIFIVLRFWKKLEKSITSPPGNTFPYWLLYQSLLTLSYDKITFYKNS